MLDILANFFYQNILPFSYVLIPVVFIGSIVSYEDFKTGKIKNQYILAMFFGGLIYHFFIGQTFWISLEVIKVFITGFLIGFGLYFIGIWPAGDAKLFSAYLLFFPIYLYSEQLIMAFTLNTFLPIFVILATFVLFRSGERLFDAVKYALNPYRIFILIMILFGVAGWVIRFMEVMGIMVNFFIAVFILFLVFEIVFSVLSIKTEIVLVSAVVLRLIFDFQYVSSISYLYESFFMIALFVFFRFFLLYLTYYFYSREVDIENLEEGMSPAEGVVKDEDEGYHKVSFLNVSLIDFMQQKKEKFIHDKLFLKEEDIEKFRELIRENELEMTYLRIDKTQHFALVLLIGYLLTVLLGGDIVSTLMYII